MMKNGEFLVRTQDFLRISFYKDRRLLMFICGVFLATAPHAHEKGELNANNINDLGIQEEPCTGVAPYESICEILPLSPRKQKIILNKLDGLDIDSKYWININESILTIAARSPSIVPFVCCDIQSSLRRYPQSDGTELVAAQFGIPREAFLQVALLGVNEVVGPQIIYKSVDRYQNFLLKLIENSRPTLNIESTYLAGFERKIYLYRVYEDRVPDKIFYFTDGGDIRRFANAIQLYHEVTDIQIPNVAFVGIESGAGKVRGDEYLKGSTESSIAYLEYNKLFRNIIVKQMEKRLGYKNGPTGRVLVGKSNGGSLVMNFMLEHPDFACGGIALSPAGKIPAAINDKNIRKIFCGEIYIGAGKYEGTFTRRAEKMISQLEKAGVHVTGYMEKSGHSFSSWVPLFLRFYEDYFFGSE